jgi:hypothetical protein
MFLSPMLFFAAGLFFFVAALSSDKSCMILPIFCDPTYSSSYVPLC